MDMSLNMTVAETFDSKTAQGYHAKMKIVDVTGGGALGSMFSAAKGTESGMTIDTHGKVLSTDGSGAGASMIAGGGTGAGMWGATLPTGPLHVGQTWTTTFTPKSTLPGAPAQPAQTMNNTVTKIAGGTVTINTSVPATAGVAGGGGTITSDISTSDGLPVKCTISNKSAVGNTEVTLTRQ